VGKTSEVILWKAIFTVYWTVYCIYSFVYQDDQWDLTMDRPVARIIPEHSVMLPHVRDQC